MKTDTPTPRTDEQLSLQKYTIPWQDVVDVNFARTLETELTTARDELLKSCLREQLLHDDYKSEKNRADDALLALNAAREERDKAIEERREETMKATAAISGLEMWKRCSQDAEKELATVTEQRDRLAEALLKIQRVGLVAVDAFDELDRIDEIVDEALAAVKGGSDELQG